MQTKLSIKKTLWGELIKQLRIRGENRRESGAFLLGLSGDKIITKIICYDELDPNVYDTGIIIFDGNGYIPLWEYCKENSLIVLADVHTHPKNWTGQSDADKQHPMIVQKGHISLIVPNYANKNQKTLRGVGVYEYLGNRLWKTYLKKSLIISLTN